MYRDVDDGLRLNDYSLVIQAALAGQGVALGWWHIVEHLITQRLLQVPIEAPYREADGFFLIWPAGRPLADEAEQVRDWLLPERDSRRSD